MPVTYYFTLCMCVSPLGFFPLTDLTELEQVELTLSNKHTSIKPSSDVHPSVHCSVEYSYFLVSLTGAPEATKGKGAGYY